MHLLVYRFDFWEWTLGSERGSQDLSHGANVASQHANFFLVCTSIVYGLISLRVTPIWTMRTVGIYFSDDNLRRSTCPVSSSSFLRSAGRAMLKHRTWNKLLAHKGIITIRQQLVEDTRGPTEAQFETRRSIPLVRGGQQKFPPLFRITPRSSCLTH